MPRLKTAPAPPITDAPLGSQTGDILQIPYVSKTELLSS